MQLSLLEVLNDKIYEGKRVMIGLSGGINSAAALCYLNKFVEDKPKELYLYYAHFDEHSEETAKFVHEQVAYAEQNFDKVHYEQSNNSLLEHMESVNTIYSPKLNGCTMKLKVFPMIKFMKKHEIDIDIVGYVRSEYKRIQRQVALKVKNKQYLISHLSNEDCFSLVEKEIGWYPSIYNIKWTDERIIPYLDRYATPDVIHPQQAAIIRKYANRGYGWGKAKRVFKHNNCLPCKNMHQWELFMVRIFFPDHHAKAMALAADLGRYWGRPEQSPMEVETTCTICSI
jgi:3'-phosphoadenosine 5'-phosphosulfate sulfotransferase (PAPS reductase)/FAD synthetase